MTSSPKVVRVLLLLLSIFVLHFMNSDRAFYFSHQNLVLELNQVGTKFWEFFAEPFLRLTTKTIFQIGRFISRVTKQRIADLPVPENREEVFKRNERIFTEHLEWNSDDFWKHQQAVHFQKLLRDDDDATSSPNRITAPTMLTPINVNSTGKNE